MSDFQPPNSPPPSYRQVPATPAAGNRIPCTSNAPFPPQTATGPAPFHDLDGSPVFVASALMGDSVQPCKANGNFQNPCRVGYGGGEKEHAGRFDILPITEAMQWIPARDGKIPQGARPVEGGYEADGKHLYHVYATVNGIPVPGKIGEHLNKAHIPFGGKEHRESNYFLLVWR